tara:strand:+ start:999 stop:1754 length:756 start_codon:yes stop_codon:yes gene_type:complete
MTPTSSSDALVQHSLQQGTYGYAATDVNNLEATEYTLVTIVVDESSSVWNFKTDLEDMIKKIIESCKEDPRAENLMIRLVAFNTTVREIHGFKILSECNADDYNDSVNPSGMTALYDSTQNALLASFDYADNLVNNDFDVNAVNFVLTDGGENSSRNVTNASEIATLIQDIRSKEALESVLTILIGVGAKQDAGVSTDLKEFNDDGKMDQYIETEDATPQTLAKLANFISKSISSQSRALNSGGASQLLQF